MPLQLDLGPTRRRRPTVLLVDDEASVRTLFAAVLRAADHEVVEAPDGARALDVLRARQGAIDLVVLDWRMPVMDGPTFCKACRQLRPEQRVPILVICTEPDEVDRAGGMIHAVVGKPVSMSDLLEHVRRFLEDEIGPIGPHEQVWPSRPRPAAS
ncbi:MAG: response regulator [Vicinamibacterales bacterium]